MIGKGSAILIAVVGVCACARANDPRVESSPARYIFSKAADGFLRLDTQTGQVALCSQQSVGWACLAAPEDRTVLENEIARLRRENGTLKTVILSRGLPLPPGIMPEPAAGSKHPGIRLPGGEDIGRVVALLGRIWHRLVGVFASAQHAFDRG